MALQQRPGGHPWLRRPALIAGTAAGVLVVGVVVWVLGPGATWVLEHLDGVHGLGGKEKADALDAIRGRVITIATGLLAIVAVYYTARNATTARRTFQLGEQGQVTDRYTKAIEQLGSDKLDIRLGGIYALERIARDSARDHPTIIEVLAAFLREHTHDDDAHAPAPDGAPDGTAGRLRPDLQAALTVLSRRNNDNDADSRIDLSDADLRTATLTATLILSDANPRIALLNRASVPDILINGYLRGANLTGANLCGAKLSYVYLSRANLTGANLREVDLTGTILSGADLSGADLTGADLTGADLSDAHLSDAHLDGAHLTGVRGLPPGFGGASVGPGPDASTGG